MGSHIVHSYDKDLNHLVQSIVEMGGLIKELLKMAEMSITQPESNLVDQAKATDKRVNALDSQIERQATALLALRQPMAIDLRVAISALKVAVMMERMGDLAKNCTKRAMKISFTLDDDILLGIRTMSEKIETMMTEAMDAFVKNDAEAAREVALEDEEVDVIYKQLMEKLQTQMSAAPNDIPSYLQVIFVVRNIERIGDYVTKIARIVHYIALGERAPKLHKTEPNL